MQKNPLAAKLVDRMLECLLFKNISEQTLYLIAHELGKEKIVSKNTMVYSMLKGSAFAKKKTFSIDIKASLNKHNLSLVKKDNVNKDLIDICEVSKKVSRKIHERLLIESKGLYIILSGNCEIKNPRNDYIVSTIQTGDFFGGSDFFNEIGYDYFGNITTFQDSSFLYISKNNLKKIPLYDQQQMRVNARKNKVRLRKIIFQCTEIYGGNPYTIKY